MRDRAFHAVHRNVVAFFEHFAADDNDTVRHVGNRVLQRQADGQEDRAQRRDDTTNFNADNAQQRHHQQQIQQELQNRQDKADRNLFHFGAVQNATRNVQKQLDGDNAEQHRHEKQHNVPTVTLKKADDTLPNCIPIHRCSLPRSTNFDKIVFALIYIDNASSFD